MRKLRIVGDGERDAHSLPGLVRGILQADFECKAESWQSYPRLHRPEKKIHGYSLKGYGTKLLYVLRSARAAHEDGVVATVDADKDRGGERLGQMRLARDADRSKFPPLPTALGEARPHNEAWLLDDPAAVREVLQLSTDVEIPTVTLVENPKAALEELLASSPRADDRPKEVWAELGANVSIQRCNQRERTGLEAFAREVQSELGPLFAAS